MLTIGAIAAVWLLVERASSSRAAQLQVAAMRLSLANLQSAPFSADLSAGSGMVSQAAMQADEESLSRGLTVRSQAWVPLPLLAAGRSSLTDLEPVVTSIYETALERGGLAGARVPKLQKLLITRSMPLAGVLDELGRADATRAADARMQTKLGATAALLLLLLAFGFFYFRSVAARGGRRALGP